MELPHEGPPVTVTIGQCELRPRAVGGEGEGVNQGDAGLRPSACAANASRQIATPTVPAASGTRTNSGEEEQVEWVGHETGEELLDAVERNCRGQAGGKRDDSAEGKERTRVVEGSTAGGQDLDGGSGHSVNRIPLGVWEERTSTRRSAPSRPSGTEARRSA